MQRTFSKPRLGLQRDLANHRTGFHIYIKVRKPMSQEGYKRWGNKQKIHIAKSRWVYPYYSCTRASNLPNGVPIDIMATDKTFAEFCIRHFLFDDNKTYYILGWTGGKTKTFVKLTKKLCKITVHDAENLKYEITDTGRLNRYWFRRKSKQENNTTE